MSATPASTRSTAWRPWRLAAWTVAALLLSLPWVAMQFTKQVAWTASDFAIIGVLLGLGCLAFELAARFAPDFAYLCGAALAVATGFVLVWVNLAVGIIGAEDEPANLMFGGVLLVGLAGAAIARLRARGLAIAAVATALAQASVSAIALARGLDHPWPLNLLFAGAWLACAMLFHVSARRPGEGAG
jgi:hypothetical protein